MTRTQCSGLPTASTQAPTSADPTLRASIQFLEALTEGYAGAVELHRIFRLYLGRATLGFDSGTYRLNQTLMVKPDRGRAGLPLTRGEWYAE